MPLAVLLTQLASPFYLVCVALDGDADGAAEAQVRNLEDQVCVLDQQVLGLEIAVQHAVFVTVSQALDQLVHQVLSAGQARARSGGDPFRLSTQPASGCARVVGRLDP